MWICKATVGGMAARREDEALGKRWGLIGQETTGVRIELAPRVRVRGTLVDFEGRPAAGLRVAIGAQSGSAWGFGGEARENVSDAAGRFEVPNAPSGAAQILVSPTADLGEFDYVVQLRTIAATAPTATCTLALLRQEGQPTPATA